MVLTIGALALTLGLTACTGDADPTPSGSPSVSGQPSGPGLPKVRKLTFGVFGSDEEVEAMRTVVDAFNATSTTRKVSLTTWPDHETALEEIRSGNAPDVFLASRIDLGELVESEALRPVSLLLDERGVDFGDRFSRDAVDAFAYADELQCMAYSASPMVIYYNDELVDFDKMERRGLEVPAANPTTGLRERWSFEEFEAAARFASRRGDVRGVWIDPTLEGLSPFIESGGGEVFDDDEAPTSLAFSEESTREALAVTLPVLRNPTLTPSRSQLARNTPLQLFTQGRLAMIAGYRGLVPELRAAPGLSFDVIAMPALDGAATGGDVTGLCISSDTEDVGDAADLIAYAVSDAAVETVTRTGYIVPANTQVAASPAFLDPMREPEAAVVFSSSIRHLVVPPFVDDRTALLNAVGPLLQRLLTSPVLDLEAATEQIDLASQTVLAPEEQESETPEEETE